MPNHRVISSIVRCLICCEGKCAVDQGTRTDSEFGLVLLVAPGLTNCLNQGVSIGAGRDLTIARSETLLVEEDAVLRRQTCTSTETNWFFPLYARVSLSSRRERRLSHRYPLYGTAESLRGLALMLYELLVACSRLDELPLGSPSLVLLPVVGLAAPSQLCL